MIHTIPILKDNYAYVIEGVDKSCFIIDPGEAAPISRFLHDNSLKPLVILNTHHHGDHIGGNNDLVREFGIPVRDGFHENEIVEHADLKLRVLETPGHTMDHVAFYAPDLKALFCGDTLFSMGCGRLLEGTADDMFASLAKIKSLPPDTDIYCGHEYTLSNGDFALSVEPGNQDIQDRMEEAATLRAKDRPTIPVTLETELKTNLFLRANDAQEFARLRSSKDSF